MALSQTVSDTLDAFTAAFSARDADAVSALLASTPDVLGIGSDPAEWWAGRERLDTVLRAQLAEMAGSRLEVDQRAGGDRWVATQSAVVMPDGTRAPARLTLVCDADGKIEHFHFSVGVSNEEAIGQTLTT